MQGIKARMPFSILQKPNILGFPNPWVSFRWENLLGFFPKLTSCTHSHIFLCERLIFLFLTRKTFPLFWALSAGLMWIFHFVWCVSIYKLCFSHLLCFTLSLFPLKIKKMTEKFVHVWRWPQFLCFCSLESAHPPLPPSYWQCFCLPVPAFGHSES